MSISHHYDIVLLGKISAGKSSSGNTILGEKRFSTKSIKNQTPEVQFGFGCTDGVTLMVFDTPGLFNPETTNEDVMRRVQTVLHLVSSASAVFLLVMKIDRFTPEEKRTVELIERLVPDWLLQNTWILFTRGDELESEGLTIEQCIEETEELKRVVQRFNYRYHVFNNIKHDSDQVTRLMEKIRGNQKSSSDKEDLRIVLLGKTGVGKSATGNTILGKEVFKELLSSQSVTSVCQKESAEIGRRWVTVIDNPGLFDTGIPNEEIIKEIAKCITMAAPGPHVFLLVLTLGRFTQEEKKAVKIIQDRFGEESSRYTMVLFTRGDDLRKTSIDDYIKGSNRSLQNLIKQCGNRYHVFNNTNPEDRTQVTDLLQKINSMVAVNGGSCYTNEMFQNTEKGLREEQERILKEKKEEIEREREELRAKHEAELENLRKTMEEEQQNLEKQKREKEKEFQKKEAQIKETNEERKKEAENKLKEQREAFNEEIKTKEQTHNKQMEKVLQYQRENYEREKENIRKKAEQEARQQAEKEFYTKLEKFIKAEKEKSSIKHVAGGAVGGVAGGATLGAAIGFIGGPVGSLIGAAIGAALGGTTGAAAGAAVAETAE